jgi:drug/metabolite transporter (DMT)-like permease
VWRTPGVVAVLFVFFWSTGFIVARGAAPHADLQLFLLCRFASVALLLGIAAAAGTRWPPPRERAQHLAAGAVMMGLYLTLSFWAIAHGLPAGIMALLGAQNLGAAMIAVLATCWVGSMRHGEATRVTALCWREPAFRPKEAS